MSAAAERARATPATAASFECAYQVWTADRGNPEDAPLTARVAGVEVALADLHAAVAARGGAAAVSSAGAWPAVAAALGAPPRPAAGDAVAALYADKLAAFDEAAAGGHGGGAGPRRRTSSGSRRGGSRGPAGSTASSGADSARKRARPPRAPAGGGGVKGAPPTAPPKRSRLAGGSAAGSTAATPAVSGGGGSPTADAAAAADGAAAVSPPALAPVRVRSRSPPATPARPRPRAATPPPPPDLDLPDMLAFVRALAVRGGKAPPGVALSAPAPKMAARFARRARVALRCEKLGEKPKGGAAKRYSMAPGPDGPARRSQRARATTEIFLPSDWTPRGGRRAADAGRRGSDSGSDSDWSCGSGHSASPDRAARAIARAARKCGPAFQADLPEPRERKTRGGGMGIGALPPAEAAWIAHRVLVPGTLARGAGPAPVVMVGTGADDGAGFTPWAYVVQRSGKPVPAAAAGDLGLGSMGAPVGAAWSDAEAAAFEAALDADGREFLLRGLGQAADEAESSSSDEEEEEVKAAEGKADAAPADAAADAAPADAAPADAAPMDVDGVAPAGEAAPPPSPPPPPPPPLPTLAASPEVKAEQPATAAAANPPSPPRPTVVRSPLDCVNYYYNVWKTRATPRARAWYQRRADAAAAEAAAAAAAAAAKAEENARRSAVATEAQRRRRMREMVAWARECARAPLGANNWPSRATRYRRAARAIANAHVAEVMAGGKG